MAANGFRLAAGDGSTVLWPLLYGGGLLWNLTRLSAAAGLCCGSTSVYLAVAVGVGVFERLMPYELTGSRTTARR